MSLTVCPRCTVVLHCSVPVSGEFIDKASGVAVVDPLLASMIRAGDGTRNSRPTASGDEDMNDRRLAHAIKRHADKADSIILNAKVEPIDNLLASSEKMQLFLELQHSDKT